MTAHAHDRRLRRHKSLLNVRCTAASKRLVAKVMQAIEVRADGKGIILEPGFTDTRTI